VCVRVCVRVCVCVCEVALYTYCYMGHYKTWTQAIYLTLLSLTIQKEKVVQQLNKGVNCAREPF